MLASLCVIPCFYLVYFLSCLLTNAALTATYIESMMSSGRANTWFYDNFNVHKRMKGSNENIKPKFKMLHMSIFDFKHCTNLIFISVLKEDYTESLLVLKCFPITVSHPCIKNFKFICQIAHYSYT